jgi:hypothetical protein
VAQSQQKSTKGLFQQVSGNWIGRCSRKERHLRKPVGSQGEERMSKICEEPPTNIEFLLPSSDFPSPMPDISSVELKLTSPTKTECKSPCPLGPTSPSSVPKLEATKHC